MRCHKDTPLADRLLARRKVEGECWIWTGALDRDGYGKMKYKGVLLKVHRASMHVWKAFNLDSPELGCHSCDNRACFNPDHLSPGTCASNSWEMWQRKRGNNNRTETGQFTTPPSDNSDLPF